MKTRSIPFAFGFIVCGILPSCIATYRSIQPESMTIDDFRFTSPDSTIEMNMDYNVLTGPHNKIYAKMEKKNQVSLMAVKIQNSGNSELCMPQDLVILAQNGDTIRPLPIETGMGLLVDPIIDEESSGPVDVDPGGFLRTIFDTGELVNDVKKIQSHIRFMKDMQKHYLDDRQVDSGTIVTGFLVLPVQKGTPLIISVQHASLQ